MKPIHKNKSQLRLKDKLNNFLHIDFTSKTHSETNTYRYYYFLYRCVNGIVLHLYSFRNPFDIDFKLTYFDDQYRIARTDDNWESQDAYKLFINDIKQWYPELYSNITLS